MIVQSYLQCFSESKNPFKEVFKVIARADWTLESFMEHVQGIVSDEEYCAVCSVVGWTPPDLGDV